MKKPALLLPLLALAHADVLDGMGVMIQALLAGMAVAALLIGWLE